MEAEEGRLGGQYKGGLSLSEPAVLREPQSQCQGALAESWDWRRIGLFLHIFPNLFLKPHFLQRKEEQNHSTNYGNVEQEMILWVA